MLYFKAYLARAKGHTKVMTAGIGWAGAEILSTRFILLGVSAREQEALNFIGSTHKTV